MIGGVYDAMNIASKMTWKRATNAIRIVRSYRASRRNRHPLISGLPVSISIEPTTSCNLRCPECPSGLRAFTRPTGMLDPRMFTRLIDELAPTLTYLTFYFQGEPYLNPEFLNMVAYASQKGIYTATSTNAHYLNVENAQRTISSGLDRLIISIDGTTQQSYQSYRIGGTLDKVIEGTRNVLDAKKHLRSKTPHVVFQFLVTGPNEHEIPDVFRLGRQLGVDQVVLKTAQIYDYENGSPLIPKQDRYARYRQNPDGSWSIKNKLADHCWKMWHSCVVTWDGKIVPCCFDKDAHFVMGDLKQNSFAEIWNGDRYDHFRNSLMKSRSEIEMCRNCTEGSRVFA
ncbi:MAG: SPASM domain-containing protein [Bacteroidota bacterium]|nr:SPASM domain-containing protein [Bacteroidota bacterium]